MSLSSITRLSLYSASSASRGRQRVGIERRDRRAQGVGRRRRWRLARLIGEQRQRIERAARARRLETREHLTRPLDDGGRQARELRDLNAVGAVGRAGHDLVQEGQRSLELGHPHGEIDEPRQRLGEPRQFVEMRGEQSARTIDGVEMLDAGQAIERPSKVAVPRPISSRITSERSLA